MLLPDWLIYFCSQWATLSNSEQGRDVISSGINGSPNITKHFLPMGGRETEAQRGAEACPEAPSQLFLAANPDIHTTAGSPSQRAGSGPCWPPSCLLPPLTVRSLQSTLSIISTSSGVLL